MLERTWSGAISRIAFVAPAEPSWPLPIYELALLTAARAYQNRRPKAGDHRGRAGTAAAGRVRSRGQRRGHRGAGEREDQLHTQSEIRQQDGPLLQYADCVTCVRIRSSPLPRITGPNVRGIPGDAIDRFLRVDERCRVTGGRRADICRRRRDSPAGQARRSRRATGGHGRRVHRPPRRSRPRTGTAASGHPGRAADRRPAAIPHRASDCRGGGASTGDSHPAVADRRQDRCRGAQPLPGRTQRNHGCRRINGRCAHRRPRPHVIAEPVRARTTRTTA